jgi:hypothetical protein
VPKKLLPLVQRREVVRSLETYSVVEARNRAPLWEAHVTSLFDLLTRHSWRMSRDQIDAFVAAYLTAKLQEIDVRLATGVWKRSGGHSDPDWNDFAREYLADEWQRLQEALAYNHLKDELPDAAEGGRGDAAGARQAASGSPHTGHGGGARCSGW